MTPEERLDALEERLNKIAAALDTLLGGLQSLLPQPVFDAVREDWVMPDERRTTPALPPGEWT